MILPILLIVLLCLQVCIYKTPMREYTTNPVDAAYYRIHGIVEKRRRERQLPPNLKGMKLKWTQVIKRDNEHGSISIYTPWYFKPKTAYIALSVIAAVLIYYTLIGYPWGHLLNVPMAMGTAWIDGNTSATPTANDMDGGGTDLATGDTVNITKALVIDKSVGCGNLTITARLTINATKTLTLDAGSTVASSAGCMLLGTLVCGNSTVSFTGIDTTYGYSLHIDNGGVYTGGSGNHTWGSMVCPTIGATLTMTSGTTTVNNAIASGNAFYVQGATTTFAHSNGTLTFTYAGIQKIAVIDKSTLALYNLVVNNASCALLGTANFGPGAYTVANNLTITAGSFATWDGTTSANLTVTGDVIITGTLTGHASAVSAGSLTINSGGTYSATTGNTTITAYDSGTYSYNNKTGGTLTANNGTFIFNYTTNISGYLDNHGTGNIYNLIINHAAGGARGTHLNSATTIDGALTVTKGEFNTFTASATSAALIVTGASSVSGQLTPNTSVLTFNGSMICNNGGYLGLATAYTPTYNGAFTAATGSHYEPGTGTSTFTSTMTYNASITNNGTCVAGTSWVMAAGTTYANAGTTTVRASSAIAGGSATTSIITSAGTWSWNTCSLSNIDLQWDITTPGTGKTITFAGNMGIDAWKVTAGDTWICTTPDTQIVCNAAKNLTIEGTITFTGTSGHNIIIGQTTRYNLMGLGNLLTTNMQYVTLNSTTQTMGFGYPTAISSMTITNLDNLTLNSSTYGSLMTWTNCPVVTMTNSSITGVNGAGWDTKDVSILSGSSLQLLGCTLINGSVGMQATSGWLVSKDHGGVTGAYRFYGIANQNSMDAAYRPSSTDNVSLKNADAYSTPFNTAMTVNIDATWGSVTNVASTTLTVSQTKTLIIVGPVISTIVASSTVALPGTLEVSGVLNSALAFGVTATGGLKVDPTGTVNLTVNDASMAGTLTVNGVLNLTGKDINSSGSKTGTLTGRGIIRGLIGDSSAVYVATYAANADVIFEYATLSYTTNAGGLLYTIHWPGIDAKNIIDMQNILNPWSIDDSNKLGVS